MLIVRFLWMNASFLSGVLKIERNIFRSCKVKTEQNVKYGKEKVETSTSLSNNWRSKLKNKGKGEMIE